MLFPVVFMIHEYEEIIMFRRWITSSYLFLLFRFARFGQVSINCGLLH